MLHLNAPELTPNDFNKKEQECEHHVVVNENDDSMQRDENEWKVLTKIAKNQNLSKMEIMSNKKI